VFNKHLQELQNAIVGKTIAFAATVAEQFDDVTSQSEEPLYPRLFSVGPPRSPKTHLNQMTLALEALCFFVHAMDRISFRPHSEVLRDAVLDPTAIELSNWFEETLGKLDGKSATPGQTLSCIDFRNSQYAQAPSLLGTSANDRNSAAWLAAAAIAEDVGHPRSVFVYIVHTELLRGLVDLNLADRIKTLEELL
jgi:hypothetical protein